MLISSLMKRNDKSCHNPKYGFQSSNSKTMCHDEREILKTKLFEYIAVYQDDLYIASPTSHPLSVWEQWMHLKIFSTL